MDNWYYVDRAQSRQGPVAAAIIVEAYRNGQADENSLVWREGMAEWQPLGRFRDELGMGSIAPAAPSVSAASGSPAKKGSSGCLIIGIVVAVVLFVMMAILAAIALPAYQDYIERAKQAQAKAESEVADAVREAEEAAATISESEFDSEDESPAVAGPEGFVIGESEAAMARQAVSTFYANTDRCPRDSAELGLPPPTSPGLGAIQLGTQDEGRCTITLLLAGIEGAPELAGSKVIYIRDTDGNWTCRSNLSQQQFLAPDCR